MVTLTTGMNRIRDLFNADIYKGQLGTGTTSPLPTDTGLETEDSNTLLDVTVTTASQAVQITHTVATTVGDGSAYSEQETQLNSGGSSFNRIVHTALTKGANDEYNYITTIFIRSA